MVVMMLEGVRWGGVEQRMKKKKEGGGDVPSRLLLPVGHRPHWPIVLLLSPRPSFVVVVVVVLEVVDGAGDE